MAGILDNKSRIIDAYITQEGRRQLANGQMRIKYASFTDATAFYAGDVASGSADATVRIYLEAGDLPQDQIVFESDDSGRLMPFEAGSPYNLLAGQLISYSQPATTASVVTGSNRSLNILTGSEFASTMRGFLSSSIDNYQKLYSLSSFDTLFGEVDFAAGPTKLTYTLTDASPVTDPKDYACRLQDLESLFSDPRFSTVPNFQYLPPVNKPSKNSKLGQTIGNYPAWGGVMSRDDAFTALNNELDFFAKAGFCRTISIDPTSTDNNIIGQMFEVNNETAKKLDLVHFGKFFTPNSAQPIVDIYFAGKIFVDDNSSQNFVHLFTLIFG